jgi:hypothetical protein
MGGGSGVIGKTVNQDERKNCRNGGGENPPAIRYRKSAESWLQTDGTTYFNTTNTAKT